MSMRSQADPQNDNQTPNPADFSGVDLISSSDDEVAAIVRRTERLTFAVTPAAKHGVCGYDRRADP